MPIKFGRRLHECALIAGSVRVLCGVLEPYTTGESSGVPLVLPHSKRNDYAAIVRLNGVLVKPLSRFIWSGSGRKCDHSRERNGHMPVRAVLCQVWLFMTSYPRRRQGRPSTCAPCCLHVAERRSFLCRVAASLAVFPQRSKRCNQPPVQRDPLPSNPRYTPGPCHYSRAHGTSRLLRPEAYLQESIPRALTPVTSAFLMSNLESSTDILRILRLYAGICQDLIRYRHRRTTILPMSLTPCLPWRRLGALRRLPSKCMEQVVFWWLEAEEMQTTGAHEEVRHHFSSRRCKQPMDQPFEVLGIVGVPHVSSSALSFAFSANEYLTRHALYSTSS